MPYTPPPPPEPGPATAENYRDLAFRLSPPGPAWPQEPTGRFGRLLNGLGAEFARLHNRILDLFREMDPRTTVDMLDAWEVCFGLPLSCAELPEDDDERRQVLHAKATARGGQTPAYYIAQAAKLGEEIQILEPFQYGFQVGDAVDGINAVWDEAWAYVWIVQAGYEPEYFAVDTHAAEDPLVAWASPMLECMINRLKPSHTLALFYYYDIQE